METTINVTVGNGQSEFTALATLRTVGRGSKRRQVLTGWTCDQSTLARAEQTARERSSWADPSEYAEPVLIRYTVANGRGAGEHILADHDKVNHVVKFQRTYQEAEGPQTEPERKASPRDQVQAMSTRDLLDLAKGLANGGSGNAARAQARAELAIMVASEIENRLNRIAA